MIPTFGPIFQLQFYGTLCPCLQKSEDNNARQSVNEINTSCQRIEWIRDYQSGSTGSGGGFLTGFFAKATGSPSPSNSNNKNCVARLVLRDSGADGQPELFVDPMPTGSDDDNFNGDESNGSINDSNGGGQLKKQSNSFMLNIKLRRVDKVSLDESSGHIVLVSKPTNRDGIKSPGKELLRFVVLAPQDSSRVSTETTVITRTKLKAATSDQRNLVVHHLMVISEWERQRRSTLSASDAYESDDEDENAPNFLARRAQKATHFARREIELQQTKRDREKRKSQLIQQAGGLKYTAVAMANREIS